MKLTPFVTLQGSNAELSYSIQHLEGLYTQDGAMVVISEPLFIIHRVNASITLNTSLERESTLYGFHYYEIVVICMYCIMHRQHLNKAHPLFR